MDGHIAVGVIGSGNVLELSYNEVKGLCMRMAGTDTNDVQTVAPVKQLSCIRPTLTVTLSCRASSPALLWHKGLCPYPLRSRP